MFASIPWPLARPSARLDRRSRRRLLMSRRLTGALLAGRYQVFEALDRGPADAWRAQDRQLGSQCTLVVAPSLDATGAARFDREWRLIAGLEAPHLVSVLHVGHLPEDGRRCVVLDSEAVPLSARLAGAQALEAGEAIALCRQMLVGLKAAHAVGVVHGNLSPHAVLLEGEAVTLTGFGLTPMVAPAYAAPERHTAERLDPRADLYSVGVLLYAMLRGRPPFTEEDPVQATVAGLDAEARLRWMHAHAMPPPPRVELPSGLWGVILTLLEKRPDDRFRSADAVLVALEALGGSATVVARPPSAPAPAPPAPALDALAALEREALAGLDAEATLAQGAPEILADEDAPTIVRADAHPFAEPPERPTTPRQAAATLRARTTPVQRPAARSLPPPRQAPAPVVARATPLNLPPEESAAPLVWIALAIVILVGGLGFWVWSALSA